MFWMALLWLVFPVQAGVADQLLHVVGDRIITSSDVIFEAEFTQFDVSPIPPLNDPAYAMDDRLIDYAILRSRAGDTSIYKPASSDVEARYQAFVSRSPNYALFLNRWGMSSEQFQGFLFSRMVVERVIHRTIGLTVPRDAADYVAIYAEAYHTWMKSLRTTTVIRSPLVGG